MKIPFFTIVIPTFNRAVLLREAMQSVLAQTFKDFELIIVDDHSTDDTTNVVTSFHDSRIKYVLNDHNKGGSGARNVGIFRAKGDWIAFLDDDDIWLPKKLELQYEKIQSVDNTVGLIYTGFAFYDFDKDQEISIYTPKKAGWIKYDLLYCNCIGTFSTVAIRGNFLKKIGGLDERFEAMQDVELYVRITNISKVVFIKDMLAYLRDSRKNRISLNPQKKLRSILLFSRKYKKYIDGKPRLRHRVASQIFLFAFQQGDSRYIFSALPWTLAGIFVDIPNIIWLFRKLRSSIYRNIIMMKSKLGINSANLKS